MVGPSEIMNLSLLLYNFCIQHWVNVFNFVLRLNVYTITFEEGEFNFSLSETKISIFHWRFGPKTYDGPYYVTKPSPLHYTQGNMMAALKIKSNFSRCQTQTEMLKFLNRAYNREIPEYIQCSEVV